MNNEQYIQGCTSTEAPITPELKDRFKDGDKVWLLSQLIQGTINNGNSLDLMKKALFYGKDVELPFSSRPAINPDASIALLQHDQNIRLMHAAIGMVTESSEIIYALWKHIYRGEVLDTTNLIEEGGDIFWYLAIYANSLGASFEYMQERNRAKLIGKRYKFGFTEDAAINRDLEGERLMLEESEGSRTLPTDSNFHIVDDQMVTKMLKLLEPFGDDGETALGTLTRLIEDRKEGPGREE